MGTPVVALFLVVGIQNLEACDEWCFYNTWLKNSQHNKIIQANILCYIHMELMCCIIGDSLSLKIHYQSILSLVYIVLLPHPAVESRVCPSSSLDLAWL